MPEEKQMKKFDLILSEKEHQLAVNCKDYVLAGL